MHTLTKPYKQLAAIQYFLTFWQTNEYNKVSSFESAQSCQTLCKPMDCSPPDSPVLRIFQARILEWVAISSFRGTSRPRDQTHISRISCIGRQNSLPLSPPYWLLLRYLVKQKNELRVGIASSGVNRWPEDSYMCPEGNPYLL